jgi:hypothetical protein
LAFFPGKDITNMESYNGVMVPVIHRTSFQSHLEDSVNLYKAPDSGCLANASACGKPISQYILNIIFYSIIGFIIDLIIRFTFRKNTI